MSISIQADPIDPKGYLLINGDTAMTISLSGISTPGNINGWNIIDETTTLVLASKNAISTESAPLTCTLPASPNTGDWVQIADAAGTWETNNLTLDGNGTPIVSSSDNFICDVSNQKFELIYINSSIGWQVNA